ncbi:MAG: response regulator transcription factor [Alphaproteobacteria bacterium]|nr:response regulator transcription factor [Alphaproteobacteria bacterium]
MDSAAPSSAPADLPHVLVVDDDDRLRGLLRRYLSDQGFVVSEAGDGAEALALLEAVAVDLVVMDVMMPGVSGFEATRAIRQRSQVPILLLTAMTEVEQRIEGLESGADDYLGKPFEPRELVLRLRRILERATPIPPAPGLRFGTKLFDPVRQRLRQGEEEVRLTSAEAQLLVFFASRAGQPVARDDLIEAGFGGQERAIDVAVTRLRRKLEPDPKAPRYLQTVRGVGYVLQPD